MNSNFGLKQTFHRRCKDAIRVVVILAVAILSGCDSGSFDVSENDCIIPENNFADGGPGKDGIPSLTDPGLTDASEATYLTAESRVIGLEIGDEAIAVPHNILWWHEITNFNLNGEQLAVTYCPLTGSSISFDRVPLGGAEFGVSGLLFQNNLTMYDRSSDESLWPQMLRGGGCGSQAGEALSMTPVFDMSWAGWQALHPDTRVISGSTGFNRNYTATGYPYGTYEDLNSKSLLFSMPIDERRPPKERVLGIPGADGGKAYPFLELDDNDAGLRVVHDQRDGEAIVVFWSRAHQGAAAFLPVVDGKSVTFSVRDGAIVDEALGSTWRVDGRAETGPMQGKQLRPIAEAYVAFWFAWATFQPETGLWTAE